MKLYSFDFDKTFFFTPEPEDSKEIWEKSTGKKWPYVGWWSKVETLDTNIFDIKMNEWVKNEYDKALLDNEKYIILATGRLLKVKGMQEAVNTILNKHNLKFDEIHLNNKGDTFYFKTKLFEKLIEEKNPSEFIMYDDRKEHLSKFEEWAKTQNCKITIVDIVNKTTKYIN